MNHEELILAGNAVIDDMLRAGGTPEAFEIASERMNALPVTENEHLRHVLVEFDAANPTPEQRARFLAAIDFAPENETRLQAAQRFFWANLELLRGAIYDAHGTALPPDVDRVIARLNSHLSSYRGAQSEESFLLWAIRFVHREAELDRRFYEMFKDSRKRVLARIWSVMLTATDLGIDAHTVADIENQAWFWLRHDKESPLYCDGPGSPATRIGAYAYWLARAWKSAQLRHRDKFVSTDSDEGLAVADAMMRPHAVGAWKPPAE